MREETKMERQLHEQLETYKSLFGRAIGLLGRQHRAGCAHQLGHNYRTIENRALCKLCNDLAKLEEDATNAI